MTPECVYRQNVPQIAAIVAQQGIESLNAMQRESWENLTVEYQAELIEKELAREARNPDRRLFEV